MANPQNLANVAPALPARVLTLSPARRCSASNRIRVVTRRRPERLRQEAGELDDRRPGVAHMPIAQTRRRHRQRVLVDDLLLKGLDILSSPQRSRRVDAAHRRQRHRQTSSPEKHIRRPYRRTFSNPDHSSEAACWRSNARPACNDTNWRSDEPQRTQSHRDWSHSMNERDAHSSDRSPSPSWPAAASY